MLNRVPPPSEAVLSFLQERHPQTRSLVLWVRDQVLHIEPDLEERIYTGWNGLGYRYPDAGLVCAIYPQSNGQVRLQFERGIKLDDPDGVLEGTGWQTRYLTILEPDDDVMALINQFVPEAVSRQIFRR
ncbi:DUF1801 domain-containing protein [Arthrobacter sp.]|jgi:hypothetical protein|uniref:DUF1801 domain-containing protein n=1 Tax=Arthrobacter sp. TaxID=1667 RepID=UPI0028119BA4|nr:DUF1801 domain-containing protein [Arthrobacter sp.]